MKLPPELLRALAAVRRRVRTQRALDAGVLFLVVGLAVAAVVLTLAKTGVLEDADALRWLYGAAAIPVVGLLLGLLRPVAKLLPAQLLDRSHDLRSRIANALELASEPERTPFMEAAIDDARAKATQVVPKRAMPLRAPRDLGGALILAVAVGILVMLEVPREVPAPVVSQLEPLLLDDDSLDAFESSLDPVLQDRETSDDVREVANRLNQILEDIADRRLDRTEALRRIQQLEQQLAEGREASAEEMEEALREVGRELDRSALTEAASEALQDADAERAADEMQQLANQIANDPPSRQEMERLREALERAAQDRSERREREIEEERERLERLLQRQREQNQTESEQERRLLRRRQRQLERLQREQQDIQEQRRQLDRLRREMQQAAENLNRNAQNRDQAAEQMRRMAEELNRMAREQMSEEQRQQLERQMRQLREMIRRMQQQQGGQGQNGQGQNGQGQGQQGRMRRFVLQAGGQGARIRMPGQGQQGQGQQGQGQQGQGQGQQGQGQGQQGQGQQGQGQQGQGQGQQGQGQGQGQGQNGQGQGQGGQAQGGQGQGQNGQGQGGQQVLELTPNGQGGNAVLEMPGMGQGQQGEGQGQGQGQGGSQAGTGHDPQMLEDPTNLDSRNRNSRVNGEASGEGPSRSEVILGASDRGFVGEGYREVFTDYENHAEEVLERDEVPPGYRFYVRRYFQLIRPRE